jgi:hypothetical protein
VLSTATVDGFAGLTSERGSGRFRGVGIEPIIEVGKILAEHRDSLDLCSSQS